MALAGLSLEQAPPISVPLRFFLSAPLFLLLAAAVLLVAGPEALASRWSPASLALTHLLTLGFLAMVMIGALLQMLPVVAGASVPKPRLVAALVHVLLVCGILLLAGGFLFGVPFLLKLAVPLLAVGFALFIAMAGYSLTRIAAHNPTVPAMRLAVVALLLTVALGLALAAAFAWDIDFPVSRLTDLHAAWGALGWVCLLVIGVAYQVVPMFQLTPAYPKPVTHWLVGGMFLLLLLWSAGIWFGGEDSLLARFSAAGLAAGLVVFAAATLYLQSRRRRRMPDVTLRFWRLGMAALLLEAVLWATGWATPAARAFQGYPMLLGILFLFGFGVTVINGMLYKIVPFLVWFHLYSRKVGKETIPNMKEIIPDNAAGRQMLAHGVALPLLLASVMWPAMTYAAVAAVALSALLLEMNLVRASRVYREVARKNQAAAEL